MKKFTLTIATIFTIFVLNGQNFSDALRYSRTLSSGTARSVAVGNSIGALGADFSVASINPAGIATYAKSEFMFSPSFLNGNIDSRYNGNNPISSSLGNQFYLENVGYVNANIVRGFSQLTRSNWAIGLNRIADFNETISYSGFDDKSITERWLENADGILPSQLDNFESGLAYDAEAIYDINDDLIYDADIFEDESVRKEQTVERSGGINELSFTWAGNYNENFSIGMGIGIPIINFEENKTYFESDNDDMVPVFNELSYRENLSVSGTGFNFKIGAIWHSLPNLRIGASYTSKSWYVITEDFDTDIGYSYTLDDETFTAREESPLGSFRYRLKTPSKLRLDASYLINAGNIKGFLSAGLQYLDYASSSFNLGAYSTSQADIQYGEEINNQINNELASAYNYNVGAELAYNRWRVRTGVIFQSSPFDVDSGESSNIYSAGLGYRGNKIFIDAAWRGSKDTEAYIPYDVSNSARLQQVDIDKSLNKLVFTVGFKF